MNLQEARQFVAQFVKGDYTPEEYAAFLQWLKGATVSELNEIADEHEALHEYWDIAGLTPSHDWRVQLEGKLDGAAVLTGKEEDVRFPVIGEKWMIRRRGWVAAASVAVLLAGGAVLYMQQGGVKPARNRAELPVMAKTAVNPSGGGEKQLILADGSKVLLNVASTLKYPETFSSSERVVELSGEAYFEVAPDATKPFRVLIKDGEVNVLGTNFNVRAYADELVSKTTLIDGVVEMDAGSKKEILKPGQQAIAYSSTGEIEIVKGVDVEDVMAWKKGYFRCTNEEFQAVMRVLSRYYNVDIQCDQSIATTKISASVSRDKGLWGNLKQFQDYKFEADGKKVRVTLKK